MKKTTIICTIIGGLVILAGLYYANWLVTKAPAFRKDVLISCSEYSNLGPDTQYCLRIVSNKNDQEEFLISQGKDNAYGYKFPSIHTYSQGSVTTEWNEDGVKINSKAGGSELVKFNTFSNGR